MEIIHRIAINGQQMLDFGWTLEDQDNAETEFILYIDEVSEKVTATVIASNSEKVASGYTFEYYDTSDTLRKAGLLESPKSKERDHDFSYRVDSVLQYEKFYWIRSEFGDGEKAPRTPKFDQAFEALDSTDSVASRAAWDMFDEYCLP